MKSPTAILYDASGNPIGVTANPLAVSQAAPIQNATPVVGTITTLGGAVTAAIQGYNAGSIVVTGTWSASLVVQYSHDGGTTWWTGAFVAPPNVTAPLPRLIFYVAPTGVLANGSYQLVGMGPSTHVRIVASAYTSGTVNVQMVFSVNNPPMLTAFVQIQQNDAVSVLNSSTANLASGASFTGSSEPSTGISGIQLNLKTDQQSTVQVQQSQDGTNWDISDSFPVNANTGLGITIQTVASFFRVVVTNNGASTTTFLRLQTILAPVVEAIPRAVAASGGMKVDGGVSSGTWLPALPGTFFGYQRGQRVPLMVGADGSLQCYSEVITDAGSFREDYPGSSLQSNLTGTVLFTNGSTAVTGTGCSFTTQINRFSYIKLTGHADTVLASVLSVVDDNNLILVAAYTGATGSGVGINSFWLPTVGTGGSISVASSILSIASGTTAGSNTWVQRGADYGPMEKTIRFSVSQRIANETIRMGFVDNFASPTVQACIELTGTDNTQVSLVCRSSALAADLETVTATLPTGINTASLINLKIDAHNDRVTLYYDPADGSPPVFLAMCKNHIPAPYVSMLSGHGVMNGTTPATTTTLSVDMVYLNDYNLLSTSLEGTTAPDLINAATTSVAAAVADTTLLAVNKLRSSASIYNDSASVLYVKFGTGASTTSFKVKMPAYSYYELPRGSGATSNAVYNGQINGYWASATGNARISEEQ